MTLRAEYFDQVVVPTGPGGSAVPASGVSVSPYHVNDDGTEGALASAYTSKLTSISTTASIIADSAGRVDYFLDVGNYNIHYVDSHSPKRFPDFIRQFTAVTVDSQVSIASIMSSLDTLVDSQIIGQQVTNTGGVSDGGTSWQLLHGPDDFGDLIYDVITKNPTDLIAVWYTASWQAGGSNDQAGIWIDGQLLKVPSIQTPSGSQIQYASHTIGGSGGVWEFISSTSFGLVNNSTPFASGANSDAPDGSGAGTNPGQAIGFTGELRSTATVFSIGAVQGTTNEGQIQGGPCYISVGPGNHTVSVSYRSDVAGRLIHAGKRHLRAAVIPFPLVS